VDQGFYSTGGQGVKIVLINASPKKAGSVAVLAGDAADAAERAGAEVSRINLVDHEINHCRFCMTCHEDRKSAIGKCTLDDAMGWILPKLREADGYIMATQVSSGHANSIFKTFSERCVFTAGSSTGKVLWMKGVPETRFTDRKRYAVTIAAAGAIPTWLRMACDTATKEMKETALRAFNAKVTATMYAGELIAKGLQEADRARARKIGELLTARIARNH
jgi:multimeric flavodoxin WrbA